MRLILIGAVGSTELVLRAMNEAGYPPVLLATFDPDLGRQRHADYVDLRAVADPRTEVVYAEAISAPEFIAKIEALRPDHLFVVGWSQLVTPELRALVRGHCVGFHPTALPALRGRAVIGWTILLGLEEGGATLFEIDDGVDSGPILAQTRFALDPRETVSSYGEKLSAALDRMIRDLLPRLAHGTAQARPQPSEGISYCARRSPADSQIDWRDDARSIDRLIRASTRPYGGAFTFTRKRRVTLWAAEPIILDHAYFAAAGQIVTYLDGDPVVRCGDGCFLRLTDYDAGDKRLSGQIRLRNSLDNEGCR